MAAGDRYFIESDSGERTEVTADTLIGRSEKCDFKISRGYLSRRHAQLSLTDEGATLEDLGSVNGTFVNGKKISKKQLLKDGDTLAFDTCEYRFVWEKAVPVKKEDQRTVIRSMAELEKLIEASAPPVTADTPAANSSVGESPAVKSPTAERPAAESSVVEEPVTEPPAAKPPVVEPLIAKTPVAKPSVVERPVVKTPAEKPSVIDPPATKIPAEKPPVVETSAAKPPSAKPPVVEPPVAKTSAAKPPVAETPAVKTPAEEPTAVETPAANIPADKPLVVDPPAAKPPVVEPPIAQSPAVESPVAKPSASEPPAVEPPVAEDSEAKTPPVADQPAEAAARFEDKASTHPAPKPGSWADPERKNHAQTKMVPVAQVEERLSDFTDLSSSSTGPYLKVGNGLSKGLRIQLASTESYGEWTIGCDTSRDIVFRDEGVSSYHAKIVNEGNRWKLVDQMSTNGSFINDKKSITGYLNSGDRIRIGKIECVLVLPEGSGTAKKARKNKSVLKAVASFLIVLGLMVAAYMLFG